MNLSVKMDLGIFLITDCLPEPHVSASILSPHTSWMCILDQQIIKKSSNHIKTHE